MKVPMNYKLENGFIVGGVVVCQLKYVDLEYAKITAGAFYKLAYPDGRIYDDVCPVFSSDVRGGSGRVTDPPDTWMAVPVKYYRAPVVNNEYGEYAP